MSRAVSALQFSIRTARPLNSPYYRVLIFPSKAAMYEYERLLAKSMCRRSGRRLIKGVRGAFRFEAIAHRYHGFRRYRGKWRRSRNLGHILLYDGGFGAGIVAHECLHAALYSFPRWRIRKTGLLDEALAWRTGWLVNQFWERYYEARPPK